VWLERSLVDRLQLARHSGQTHHRRGAPAEQHAGRSTGRVIQRYGAPWQDGHLFSCRRHRGIEQAPGSERIIGALHHGQRFRVQLQRQSCGLRHGLQRQVILGGAEPAPGEDQIGTAPVRIAQLAYDGRGIIPHHDRALDVTAEGRNLLDQPVRVRVQHIPLQELVADRDHLTPGHRASFHQAPPPTASSRGESMACPACGSSGSRRRSIHHTSTAPITKTTIFSAKGSERSMAES